MRLRLTLLLAVVAVMLAWPLTGYAQTDSLGILDTLYADVARIDSANWKVTFSYTNDEDIVGFSIPIKINAGLNRIVADSVTYTDRVSDFVYKTMRADTAIQCATVGLIANLGQGARHKCLPGSGPVATVYISSMEGKPVENLKVDTTTTNPNNILMTVADLIQGTPPDTTRINPTQMSIYPAFVLKNEGAEPKPVESEE